MARASRTKKTVSMLAKMIGLTRTRKTHYKKTTPTWHGKPYLLRRSTFGYLSLTPPPLHPPPLQLLSLLLTQHHDGDGSGGPRRTGDRPYIRTTLHGLLQNWLSPSLILPPGEQLDEIRRLPPFSVT